MKILAIFGACLGAIAGALVWALLVRFTHTQYGVVACAIGVMVGYGSAILKGRGFMMGVICSALAVAAILMGKAYGVSFIAHHELDKKISYEHTIELYEELKTDAQDFALVTAEEQYPRYMIDHDYAEAYAPEHITQEDIADFKERWVPTLLEFKDHPPEFTSWRDQYKRQVMSAYSAQAFLPMIIDNLGFFDFIFAFMGLVLAFKVGSGEAVVE